MTYLKTEWNRMINSSIMETTTDIQIIKEDIIRHLNRCFEDENYLLQHGLVKKVVIEKILLELLQGID